MKIMVFFNAFLGANLFLVIYLGYPHEQFLKYASCQLIASSIVMLLEAPLLQHFLGNRNVTDVPISMLKGKVILAGLVGIASIIPAGLMTDPILLIFALVAVPTSWQVTTRTHSANAILYLLISRAAMISLAFSGLSVVEFITLFSLISSFGSYALSLPIKALKNSSLVILTSAYVSKATFAIRPVIESVIFNAVTIFIIKQLSTYDASLFYLFLRVVATSVSVTQNALYTESIGLRWHLLVERVGAAALAVILILSLFVLAIDYQTGILNYCVFISGACVVVLSQYFASFRVKQLCIKSLDVVNGIFFSIGLTVIAAISIDNKSFQTVAHAYIVMEAAIGLCSYFIIYWRR